MTTSKKISVVVASAAGGGFLNRCLESLRDQAAECGAEVLVVDRCGAERREQISRDFPFVRVLSAEGAKRAGVPELRRLGAENAVGEILAILEEHCVAPRDWLATIARSFQPGDAAIGGPILDDDYERVCDWAVYFSEYHNFLPPWPDAERYQLNGANIAYDRALVLEHREVLTAGYWEVVLHPILARRGAFRGVAKMGVHHTGPFPFGYYLHQRYLLSRVWGGAQRASASAMKRLVYLVAAPVFPCLLLARIASRALRSGQRVGKFVTAIPLLAPVVVTYVWGEWIGYLFGVGNAIEHVE